MAGIPTCRVAARSALVSLALVTSLGCASSGRPASPPQRPSATGTFLSLSDIHFDPFYDPSLVPKLAEADVAQWPEIFAHSSVTAPSTYGSDPNDPLFRSFLAAARSLAPRPDFVLLSGDFLEHDFEKAFDAAFPGSDPHAYQSFVLKTLGYVTARLREAFPGIPIYPALGNNDSFCGDYAIEPAGPFLKALREIWRPLLGEEAGTFDETFPIGGFYAVPHPTVPHHGILVLNTVFLSKKYKNTCGSGGDPTFLQLGWLSYSLQRAALSDEKIWTVEHIPPGIDVFSTLNPKDPTIPCPDQTVPLWQSDALTAYDQILAAAPGVLTASFSGHNHIDDFRLPPGGGFIHGTPAVSPVYDNNPAFQSFTYDRATGALADLRTYYLDLSAPAGTPWALEYDFDQAYGQTGYDLAALQAVQQGLANGTPARNLFLTYYPVSSKKEVIDPATWKGYSCGI